MIAIAAVDENWGLGREGQLLFHLHADLRRFRALTSGHSVLLGRRTLATFPGGKPLPGRKNVVLTRDTTFHVEGALIAHSREEALVLLAGEADAFVIGGESVYRQFLGDCDRVYLTRIHKRAAADCTFPNLDAMPEWKLTEQSKQEEDGVSFTFQDYVRR
jgi:dihydrofolate reductase